MRIKQNRTILESDNPFVIEQWKKAGYTEVGGGNELPKDGEPQDEEPKKSRKKAQE